MTETIAQKPEAYTGSVESINNKCLNCNLFYHWKKSTSSLKMQYCCHPCEVRGLGYSLEALERGIVHIRPKVMALENDSGKILLEERPYKFTPKSEDDPREKVHA